MDSDVQILQNEIYMLLSEKENIENMIKQIASGAACEYHLLISVGDRFESIDPLLPPTSPRMILESKLKSIKTEVAGKRKQIEDYFTKNK